MIIFLLILFFFLFSLNDTGTFALNSRHVRASGEFGFLFLFKIGTGGKRQSIHTLTLHRSPARVRWEALIYCVRTILQTFSTNLLRILVQAIRWIALHGFIFTINYYEYTARQWHLLTDDLDGWNTTVCSYVWGLGGFYIPTNGVSSNLGKLFQEYSTFQTFYIFSLEIHCGFIGTAEQWRVIWRVPED